MLNLKILSSIEQYELLEDGNRVILGVSGGPDSMALLTFFAENASAMNVEFSVAHLDHGKRGRESEEDQRFVQNYSERLNVPVFTKKIDLPGIIQKWGGNFQEVARRYRYQFFEEAAREWKAGVIATAHTGSDAIETALINLLRGTGARGLTGIPPSRRMNDLKIIRPLIRCTRSEILQYLHARKVSWREDRSNRSEEYTRNRIRHRLIPFLRENFNENLEETILSSVDILREEDQLLDILCYTALEEMHEVREGGVWALNLERLRAAPLALRRRVLRQAVRSAGDDPDGQFIAPDFTAIETLLELAERESSGARVDLADGIVVERSYTDLLFYPPSHEFAPVNSYETEIEVPGVTTVPQVGLSLSAEVLDHSGRIQLFPDRKHKNKSVRALFDAELLTFPLRVRKRRAGDRIQPFGMDGTKKLHDIFIDEKIPKGERDRIPVVVDNEGVLWAVGVRQSERAKVTKATKKILCLEVDDTSENNPDDVIA